METKNLFLKNILGSNGYTALTNASNSSKELKNLVFTRSLLSWIDLVNRYGFKGAIPGSDTKIEIKKTEQGLSGHIETSNEVLSFDNKTPVQLASLLAIVLEADEPIKIKKTESIIKLGKSIDCIVKAEFATNYLQKKSPKHLPVLKQGKPAPDIEPTPPEPPKLVEDVPINTSSALGKQEKKIKKSFIFKLKKHQLDATCDTCNSKLIANNQFKGCMCFSQDMCKIVSQDNDFLIKFDSKIESESILSLMEVFHRV